MEEIGILPSCFGPPLWASLHSISYAYNPKSEQEQQNYYNFFYNLGHVLPCAECKLHYAKNFNKES